MVPGEWFQVTLLPVTDLLLTCLQSEEEVDVERAVEACSSLFCSLLQRREMFRGELPGEEEAMAGACS